MKNVSRPIIELKGYRDGLHLIIHPEAPMNQIEPAIVERMVNLGDSLAGTTLTLNVGCRLLNEHELNRLKKLLSENYGLEVKRIMSEAEPVHPLLPEVKELTPELNIKSAPALHQEQQPLMNDHSFPEREETQFIRHTLRSGQVARFLEGNIIILGDVNPGAEVIAAGDIIVLGTLRGIAHAGALGNTSSVIIALHLVPTQLRIGRLITRPPAERRSLHRNAEIARVKGEAITVEEYDRI